MKRKRKETADALHKKVKDRATDMILAGGMARLEASISKYEAEQIAKEKWAEDVLNKSCGLLHLEWKINAVGEALGKRYLYPAVKAIHKHLVENGYDENHRYSYGDADGYVYYIPTKTPERGVMVYTTQNHNYLFVFTNVSKEIEEWLVTMPERDKRFWQHKYSLHIRHTYPIWTDRNAEDWNGDPDRLIPDMSSAIAHADDLSHWADDHDDFPKRRSVEYYKPIDFEIPYVKDGPKSPRFYGDFRDPEFVYSFENGKAEGLIYNLKEVELLATCYLPSIANEFGIELSGGPAGY